MSTGRRRAAIPVCVAALFAGSSVMAQAEKKGGEPTPSVGVNVFSPVEARTTVLSCKPEGSSVKKGELVCELDPSPLKERLANQEIIIRGAEAAYQGAKLAREVAELALIEYEQGTYIEQMDTIRGKVALAESERKRAEDRMAWSDHMLKKKGVSVAEYIADKLALQKAIFAFEQATTRRLVLEKFTRPKTIRELKGQVEVARSRELAGRATHELQQAVRLGLMGQVARCKVFAPADGRVTYPRPFGAGAVVRDGDVLFRLIPEGASEARAR